MSDKWKLSIGTAEGKEFVNLYFNESRFRYWSGKAIGIKLKTSENAELLRSAFELKLLEGWKPEKRIVLKKPKPVVNTSFLSQVEVGLSKPLRVIIPIITKEMRSGFIVNLLSF